MSIEQKTYKVYTTTLKSCMQNSYHLATFNNRLVSSNEVSKYIREEACQAKAEEVSIGLYQDIH